MMASTQLYGRRRNADKPIVCTDMSDTVHFSKKKALVVSARLPFLCLDERG